VKKAVSLLFAMIFVFGMIFGTSALSAPKPTEKSGTGIVKTFTDKSLTVVENGKVNTYTITNATKVIQQYNPASFTDVIKKGLLVTFKASGNVITYIDIPVMGSENQGDLKIKAVDINVANTDSNIAVPPVNITSARNQTRKESGEEEATGFCYGNDGNMNMYTGEADSVSLGAYEIIPGSVKATLDGKELKVIEGTAEFDKKAVDDEAKLVLDAENGNIWKLKFEKNLYEDETKYSIEDLESRLQVSYKKKLFDITTYEITDFPFSEAVIVELNGKEVPLVRALNRSTYSLFTTNTDGEVVYVNSYYRNLQCRIDSIKGNVITISKMSNPEDPNSRVLWSDTLTISPNVLVLDPNSAPIEVTSLKTKDIIKLTVDPYDGYKVSEIYKVK
jgi:hypothetical protein